MDHSPAIIILRAFAFAGALLGALSSTAAQAAEFEPAGLPAHLSARAEHVPKPFPEDDTSFRGEGANPLVVTGGVLVGSAVVAGLVAAAAHGRSRGAETAQDKEKAEKLRNGSGYAAIGLAGAGGICLVLSTAL